MNISEAPKPIQSAFEKALKTKAWLDALTVLTANGCTAIPKQAPELRDALRADPSLLKTGTLVKGPRGKIEVTAACLEPEREPSGFVIDAWLDDVVSVEDRFPHFTSSEQAAYQVHHYMMFGDRMAAVAVLRSHGLSARVDDYGGKLFRAVRGAVHRSLLEQMIACDRRSIAIRQEPQQ